VLVPKPDSTGTGPAGQRLDRNSQLRRRTMPPLDASSQTAVPFSTNPTMNANATEIARHKTAIRRPGFSLPIKCLLRDGFPFRRGRHIPVAATADYNHRVRGLAGMR